MWWGGVEKLREIYKGRFTHIKFLMPFYNGEDKDIITVYENSYQFQGYLAQGFDAYYNEEFDNYIFCADDVFLNPEINEENIFSEIGIPENSCYISEAKPVNQKYQFGWTHTYYMPKAFTSRGCEWNNILPSREEALDRINRYFSERKGNRWEYPLEYEEDFFKIDEKVVLQKEKEDFLKWNKGRTVIYPLVFGYSDFLIVNQKYIKEFIRICGIFAAMNLFVEIAIPTALLLVDTNTKTGEDSKRHTIWFCGKEQRDKFEAGYFNSIPCLIREFPKDILLFHPVKLSVWQM